MRISKCNAKKAKLNCNASLGTLLPIIILKLNKQTLRALSAFPLFLNGQVTADTQNKILSFTQSIPNLPLGRNSYLRTLFDVLYALWCSYFPKLSAFNWKQFQEKLKRYLLRKEEPLSLPLALGYKGFVEGYYLPSSGTIGISLTEKEAEEKVQISILFFLVPRAEKDSHFKGLAREALRASLYNEIWTVVLSSLKTRDKGEKRQVVAESQFKEILKRLKQKGLVDEEGTPLADMDKIREEIWPGKKICPYCGKLYTPRRKDQKTCGSSTCRSRKRRRMLKLYKQYGI